MMQQLSIRQKLMIAAIPVLLLGAMWMIALSSSRLKVASTDPAAGKKINVYNAVFIHYSQNVNAAKVKVTTDPSFSFTTKASGNTLTITPQDQLKNNTTYTLTAKNVCAQKNSRDCVDYSFKFSTDNTIALSELSPEQQKQVVADVDAQYHQAPILSILPVSQTDFLIDAKPVGTVYTYVVITPNVYAESMTQDEYESTYAKYLQEGKDYLTQKGYGLQGTNYKVMSDQEYAALTAGGGD